MMQQVLFDGPKPTVPACIDLRCCDAAELVADPELLQSAHLVHADPPWQYCAGRTGRAEEHYTTIPMDDIVQHVSDAYAIAADDAYLVLWCTFPFLIAWLEVAPKQWEYVTGGTWGKTGQPGTGYHWRGDAELVLVYRKGRPWLDPSVCLRNHYLSHRGTAVGGTLLKHSEKPVPWLTDMVRKWCPPGGRVVELYAGLGSMARAVLQTGEQRSYVGAEIDPNRHADAMALIAQTPRVF